MINAIGQQPSHDKYWWIQNLIPELQQSCYLEVLTLCYLKHNNMTNRLLTHTKLFTFLKEASSTPHYSSISSDCKLPSCSLFPVTFWVVTAAICSTGSPASSSAMISCRTSGEMLWWVAGALLAIPQVRLPARIIHCVMSVWSASGKQSRADSVTPPCLCPTPAARRWKRDLLTIFIFCYFSHI